MSTVILDEKPSQVLAYASALKQSTKKTVILRSKTHYLQMKRLSPLVLGI